MAEHAVVIAGGGPTGLMLAGELALAGVDVAIVERRASQDLAGSRAGGLHARTLEILDQRGIVDLFLAEGQQAQATGFAGVQLDLRAAFRRATRTSWGCGRSTSSGLLAGWVEDLGVPIHRGADVTGFTDDEGGRRRPAQRWPVAPCAVPGRLRRRAQPRPQGRRHRPPGSDPTTSSIIAEAELATDPPEWGIRRDAIGIHALGRVEYEIRDGQIIYADHGPVGVMVTERNVGATTEPTLGDLREALIAVYGTDYGIHDPTSITRFTDAARQAADYRKGRVLLAGDAAHIHPPDGGQGLQTGVQDAVNLGWKLAQVVKGTSPESLLDTYHAERHPVAARVLRHTLASVSLRRDDDRTRALRDTMAELLAMDEPRRTFAATMSGLDIHYDLGEGDIRCSAAACPIWTSVPPNGPLRVFTLLHGARPVLLDFGALGSFDIAPWADRVQLIDATFAGAWEIPVLGVKAPEAVLVRPDGYVAWVGDGQRPGSPRH